MSTHDSKISLVIFTKTHWTAFSLGDFQDFSFLTHWPQAIHCGAVYTRYTDWTAFSFWDLQDFSFLTHWPRAKHYRAVNTCWWALVGCYTSVVDSVNDLSRRAGASSYALVGADLVRIRVTSFRTRGCTVTENLTFNFTLCFCIIRGGRGKRNNSHTELCITYVYYAWVGARWQLIKCSTNV